MLVREAREGEISKGSESDKWRVEQDQTRLCDQAVLCDTR